MEKDYIVSVDLGGTKICAGICTKKGRIIGKIIKIPTESNRPAGLIVKSIVWTIEESIKTADIRKNDIIGIGIGSPGPLDMEKGIITFYVRKKLGRKKKGA